MDLKLRFDPALLTFDADSHSYQYGSGPLVSVTEALGDTERAQEILETGPTVAVVVPVSTPQVAGISYRETWAAEVVDLKALAQHAITTGQMNLILPNETAINRLARALKDTLRIPGVKAVKSRSVAAGRR